MKAWIDGGLVNEAEAVVSAFDHGLTVGDGVFETIKVLDGVPFALGRHLDRLTRSATGLGLPEPDREEVAKACASVVAQAPVGMHRLRITYTGGIAPLGSGRGDGKPTLLIALAPLERWPEQTAVAVVPWLRNERGALAGLKTTSYAENVVALAYAKRFGAGEALFADTRGRLSEGTGSNVFLVLDGQVMTPALTTGCLAGVTRALVLEWTGATEAELPLELLGQANEVFLTSTTRDVQAVSAITGEHSVRALGTAPGAVTLEVAATFTRRSRKDSEP
jgi:branched-chain amino acid aminotransferase